MNRSLRAPQLIFMPGGTATAAVATVAQQQPQQQPQQQQEVPPTSSSNQSDTDQARFTSALLYLPPLTPGHCELYDHLRHYSQIASSPPLMFPRCRILPCAVPLPPEQPLLKLNILTGRIPVGSCLFTIGYRLSFKSPLIHYVVT